MQAGDCWPREEELLMSFFYRQVRYETVVGKHLV